MSGSHFAWKLTGSRMALLATILGPSFAVVQAAQAQTETVLCSFTGSPQGDRPKGGVILDGKGNLYGTTLGGGTGPCIRGCGTVFEMTTTGSQQKVLYSFGGKPDGVRPRVGLVRDSAGNLYGTTDDGGIDIGTVFEVSPTGTETVLYRFPGYGGPAHPRGSLVLDAAGNLYGTTWVGGTYGNGVIYEITPSGTETVIHNFSGAADGAYPLAGLIQDAAGNFYGTTEGGGTFGPGAVFEMDPSGAVTLLYSFTGFADGAFPEARLARDPAGNLYGTTPIGGAYDYGVVFEVTPSGTETVLHSFTGGADGAYPVAGLVLDAAGNLYGTTSRGGAFGGGVVFELSPSGTETVLYSFMGSPDGSHPLSDLVRDAQGNLYGTTSVGGVDGKGTVFQVSP